jgi:hypothetical protein
VPSEAAGPVPVLRDRLREYELVQTQFMLVLGNELFEPHASERWRDLARMPRADFEAEVEAFLKPGDAGDRGRGSRIRLIFGGARLG